MSEAMGRLWLIAVLFTGCSGGAGLLFDAAVDAPSYEVPPSRSVVDFGAPAESGGLVSNGDGGRLPGAHCDVVMQDCGGSLACYRAGCATPGTVGRGEPCDTDGDCLPRNICVLLDGKYTCQRACSVELEMPCEGRCSSIPGQADLGRCAL